MTGNSEQITLTTAMERALLLALALKWRKQSDDKLSPEEIKDLEREIWLSHIHYAMDELENSVSLIAKHFPPQDYIISLYFQSQPNLNNSPLSFLSRVNYSSSIFSSQPGQSSLLSSLSISAQEQFRGHRQLSEFILPDSVSVALESKKRTTFSHKVCKPTFLKCVVSSCY